MGVHAMLHEPRTVRGATRWRRGCRVVAACATAAALATSSVALALPAGAATNSSGKLAVEAPGVTVLKKGDANFVKGKTNQKIGIGDTIQTDGTGLAQLTFQDGSLTRLDHNTVFTLDKLSDKIGKRKVEGTVSAGQTWNRVQKLSESDTFQQTGNGASAVVLGTAFQTRCNLPSGVAFRVVKTKKALKKLQKASSCQFTLVDGKLQLSSLGKLVSVARGQQVSVDVGGNPGSPETLPPDVLFSDQWIVKNLDADAKAGLAEARGDPTADDLNQAWVQGDWPVTLQVASTTGFRDLAGGTTRERTYTLNTNCNAGTCSMTLIRDTGNGVRTIPLTFHDGVYSATDPDLGTQNCERDDGTVSVADGLRNSSNITFRVSNAAPKNGFWKATALTGTVTENADQIAGGAGQCLTGSASFDLSASRGA
jgi:FecR protein